MMTRQGEPLPLIQALLFRTSVFMTKLVSLLALLSFLMGVSISALDVSAELGMVIDGHGRLDANEENIRQQFEFHYRELESRAERALASSTANALSSSTWNFDVRRIHVVGECEMAMASCQRNVAAIVAQSRYAISAAESHLAADRQRALQAVVVVDNTF